ncbi:DEAD/DEAH box helicase [Pantoea ananatis]
MENNKQVAVLVVPTTSAAQQHYDELPRSFRQLARAHRNAVPLPQAPGEQNQIPQEASEGEIDILIGTHKLLMSDIKWHDLGLLIVDEEHRFGVPS